MVATLAAMGSVLTVEDFARHRGEAPTPISTNYRGVDLVEIPPNTQGLTALVMLNILEHFELGKVEALGPERFAVRFVSNGPTAARRAQRPVRMKSASPGETLTPAIFSHASISCA